MITLNNKTYQSKELIGNLYLGNIICSSKNYQAFYASSDRGTFYIVYALFDIDEKTGFIKNIEFSLKNYKRNFTKYISFPTKNLKPYLINKGKFKEQPVLKMKLPINRGFKRGFFTTSICFDIKKVKEQIKLSEFDFFYVKKIYVNKGNVIVNNGEFNFPNEITTKAFGNNCEESLLEVTDG